MAAKRIVKSSINWAQLAERVPEHQRSTYQAFKAKSDGYLRKVLAYPENPPTIDWSHYKAKVPVAGMVDDFQKQYSALKIPYPPDTVSSQIDALEKEIRADIEAFNKESNEDIAKYKKELDHLNSLLPYSEMTMEDFKDAHPDIALDPVNRPTFWPHDGTDDLENERRIGSDH
ncbi:ATP synthase subunit d, mitochondrial-like [Coccinella septempunctata]|uniref:ATP synthase subunit d, mitochondrial-like n=1 Tax=Coccinella septempunctata TaxID=41139 RepID=UPI001D097308|nr:ATP synthase subunit d, mitochondrial-like [Coccinella septempunctata]